MFGKVREINFCGHLKILGGILFVMENIFLTPTTNFQHRKVFIENFLILSNKNSYKIFENAQWK